MRLAAAVVASCGLVSTALAFAMPSYDMLGNTPPCSRNKTDPCTLANNPAVNASIQLSSWMECQVNGFIPYPANGAWDKVFAAAFSTDLMATFNTTQYNYAGWLALYHSFNVTLGQNFAPFKHGIINSLAVPNANSDKGGLVYLIGWEGGMHKLLKKNLYFTDAAFAVVKDVGGQRKIVEFRESSNIPNTAPMPDPNPWECMFTYS